MLPVQLKILDERLIDDHKLPTYHSEMAAGVDLVACIDKPIRLMPGDKAELIPTGIAVHIGDPNYAAVILPRSGLGHKKGLVIGNLVGLIDADYQGQIFVSAWNRNAKVSKPECIHAGAVAVEGACNDVIINPGDRIAQLVFLPVARAVFDVVSEFDAGSERGEGGFGHTGTGAKENAA
jgi:dUTP pyrophosphatase